LLLVPVEVELVEFGLVLASDCPIQFLLSTALQLWPYAFVLSGKSNKLNHKK